MNASDRIVLIYLYSPNSREPKTLISETEKNLDLASDPYFLRKAVGDGRVVCLLNNASRSVLKPSNYHDSFSHVYLYSITHISRA